MRGSKTSPGSRQLLSSLVSKYLKYLVLNKTASSHTSKSYAKDLQQFLTPLGVNRITYYFDSDECRVDWAENYASRKCSSLEELLPSLLPIAWKGWQRLRPASRNRKNAVLKSFFGWLFEQGHIQEDL